MTASAAKNTKTSEKESPWGHFRSKKLQIDSLVWVMRKLPFFRYFWATNKIAYDKTNRIWSRQ